ncbi:hypothetical protein NM688_g3189 [Phlebia brevispora]|uniref:Uncharacterized protein n=1 Tax=Phlebia brevispora TaxID=194682 RepID=A0ACC1T6J1_9APHY|nr:hypothetical protein NM688_g3189 [Phlebia brevispora]
MTDSASDSTSLSITDTRALYVADYCSYAVTALALYEYLLLLPSEARVWNLCDYTKRRVVNARGALELNTISLPSQTPKQGCKLSIGFFEAVYILQYILFAVFSALRVYAIADRNRVFFCFDTAVVRLSHRGQHVNPGLGQPLNGKHVSHPRDVNKPFLQSCTGVYITRIPVIIADILCVLVTWRRTASFSGRTPLLWVMLRDGTMYFLVMLAINVAQIILETATFFTNAETTPIATVISVLTPILISRFILNLRQIGQEHQLANRNTFQVSTAIGSFALSSSVVGNLGEPLDHGLDGDDDFAENEDFGSAADASGSGDQPEA